MKKLASALAAAAALTLAAGPAQADTRYYRVEANSTKWIDLTVCAPRISLRVQGDGDTDLDFTIYDPGNNVIYTDFDATDYTSTVFRTTILPGEQRCTVYKLKVQNLGNVWNRFSVAIYNA